MQDPPYSKCTAFSSDGRYYAVGQGTLIRIFETKNGSFVSSADLREQKNKNYRLLKFDVPDFSSENLDTINKASSFEESIHEKARSLSSMRDVFITALIIGKLDSNNNHKAEEYYEEYFCIAGFNNSILMNLRIDDNSVQYHRAISDTLQTIISISSANKFLFVLCKNKLLHVVNCLTGDRIISNVSIPSSIGCIAVTNTCDFDDKVLESSSNAYEIFDVLLCGITNYLCRINVNSPSNVRINVIYSFAGTTFIPNLAWICPNENKIAFTCAPNEGVARIWDLNSKKHNLKKNASVSRCRKLLICQDYITSIACFTSLNKNCLRIAMATITGSIYIWNFLDDFFNSTADPFPVPADIAFESTLVKVDYSDKLSRNNLNKIKIEPTSKLLDAFFLETGELIVARGNFALPFFMPVPLDDIFKNFFFSPFSPPKKSRFNFNSSKSVPGEPLHKYFLSSSLQNEENHGITLFPFEKTTNLNYEKINELDNSTLNINIPNSSWTTHAAETHRALITAAEDFKCPVFSRADNIKLLPVPSKERMNIDVKLLSDHSASGTLSLALVPLYQALHANDKSLVLELISLSSRNKQDMMNTVDCLSFSYTLQLLHILIERLAFNNQINHPFHSWISAIMKSRGMEMIQAESKLTKADENIYKPCNPSVVLKPILYRYRQMTEIQEQINFFYGRLSVFKFFSPCTKEELRDPSRADFSKIGSDPAIFPFQFKEIILRKDQKKNSCDEKNSGLNFGDACRIVKIKNKQRENIITRLSALKASKKAHAKKKNIERNLDDKSSSESISNSISLDNEDYSELKHSSKNNFSHINRSDLDEKDFNDSNSEASAENIEEMLNSEEELGLDSSTNSSESPLEDESEENGDYSEEISVGSINNDNENKYNSESEISNEN